MVPGTRRARGIVVWGDFALFAGRFDGGRRGDLPAPPLRPTGACIVMISTCSTPTMHTIKSIRRLGIILAKPTNDVQAFVDGFASLTALHPVNPPQ